MRENGWPYPVGVPLSSVPFQYVCHRLRRLALLQPVSTNPRLRAIVGDSEVCVNERTRLRLHVSDPQWWQWNKIEWPVGSMCRSITCLPNEDQSGG